MDNLGASIQQGATSSILHLDYFSSLTTTGTRVGGEKVAGKVYRNLEVPGL